MPPKPSNFSHSRGSTYEQVRDNLIIGAKIVESISEATELLAPLKATCKLIVIILETTRAVNDNTKGWIELNETLTGHLVALEPYLDRLQSQGSPSRVYDQELIGLLKIYAENLQTVHKAIKGVAKARQSGFKGLLSGLSKARLESEEITRYNQDLARYFQQFMASLQTYIAMHIQTIAQTVEAIDQNVTAIAPLVTANALHNLGRASASGNVHQVCLQGTRVAIIQAIRDWAQNKGEGGDKPIFWLRDIAGSGKSTVALTMSKEWKEHNLLAGEFFFSISDAEISGTRNFCSAIARDMHAYCPHLRLAIERASTEDTTVSTRRFEEQFEKLILKPLRSNRQPLIIVIDAVDECGIKERKALLEALVANIQSFPTLKMFITSRPEPDISVVIAASAIVHSMEFRLHGAEYSYNVEDISRYIHHHLSDSLSEEQCQGLLGRANGLFIWASTAQQEFQNSDETIGDIFNRLMSPKAANNLDSLYISILERAAVVAGSEDLMCRVLGVLASAFEPISIPTLETFVPIRAEKLVQRLASVVKFKSKDDPILFRHPTFREFLLRSYTGKYHIDMPKTHDSMTRTCLETMKYHLRFNLCNIESSYMLNEDILDMDSRVERYISPLVRYSVWFWIRHLSATRYQEIIWSKVQWFMDNQFLYWLEVLSLTRRANMASLMIIMLIRWIRHSALDYSMAMEMKKFIPTFRDVISQSAPHIYLSALPFVPYNSMIRRSYASSYPGTVRVESGGHEYWPRISQIVHV
ncbi:hypothetical protein CPB86DRAFT_56481 [Serendipita vermifera]|nr:hypothetical protein CPB86DRAFT_56481 [Serendipita vermifera]